MVAALFSGCRTARENRIEVPVVTVRTDTCTRLVHRETTDTVFVRIPAQSAERTTRDSVSHLETGYAESDVVLNLDGSFSHTLRNRDVAHQVSVTNTVDTVYVYRATEIPVPVEVRNDAASGQTWRDRLRVLVALLLLLLLILYAFRRFRH